MLFIVNYCLTPTDYVEISDDSNSQQVHVDGARPNLNLQKWPVVNLGS